MKKIVIYLFVKRQSLHIIMFLSDFSLYVYFCVYLFVSISLRLFVNLSCIFLYIFLPLFVFTFLSMFLSTFVSTSVSIPLRLSFVIYSLYNMKSYITGRRKSHRKPTGFYSGPFVIPNIFQRLG